MVNRATTSRNLWPWLKRKGELQSCIVDNPSHRVCFPYVGACAMEISFPVLHMTAYEEFKDVFLQGFCKGQAFARHWEAVARDQTAALFSTLM